MGSMENVEVPFPLERQSDPEENPWEEIDDLSADAHEEKSTIVVLGNNNI